MVDKHILHELLSYDPDTGVFVWKAKVDDGSRVVKWFNTKFGGKQAGSLHHTGYRHIKIEQRKYPEHRLAWILMTGDWPEHEVDHVNGSRDDNRWCNLRTATAIQNRTNKRDYINTTAHKGVHAHRSGAWRVYINASGKRHNLGCFPSVEEAIAAREAAELVYHGQWRRKA